MRLSRIGLTLLAAAALIAPARAQQDPAVTDLLRVVNAYIADYAPRVSGTTMEERYTMMDVTGGRMGVPIRVSSEIVFLNVNGRVATLRDAFSIDGAKLRDSQSRIVPLLVEPTQAGWQQAQQMAAETYRHFRSELIVRVNDPALALRFITAELQSKFTYSIDGKKKMGGVEAVGLRFAEVRGDERLKYILGTRGNSAASGRLWVDPVKGTVMQTELALESKTETARANITYSEQTALGLWLPSKSSEDYDIKEGANAPTNLGSPGGGFGTRLTYQCNAAYSNAKRTPIDLSKMR